MNEAIEELDRLADDIERIAMQHGTRLIVNGGTVTPGNIFIQTTGEPIDQPLANKLAAHLGKRLPIYDSPAGDIIEVTR